MNWIENVNRWRALPEERKLQIRWEAIPSDVAQSMAFEGEPVPESLIREILAQIGQPKTPAANISTDQPLAQAKSRSSSATS